MINKQRVRRIKNAIYLFIVVMFFLPLVLMIIFAAYGMSILRNVQSAMLTQMNSPIYAPNGYNVANEATDQTEIINSQPPLNNLPGIEHGEDQVSEEAAFPSPIYSNADESVPEKALQSELQPEISIAATEESYYSNDQRHNNLSEYGLFEYEDPPQTGR